MNNRPKNISLPEDLFSPPFENKGQWQLSPAEWQMVKLLSMMKGFNPNCSEMWIKGDPDNPKDGDVKFCCDKLCVLQNGEWVEKPSGGWDMIVDESKGQNIIVKGVPDPEDENDIPIQSENFEVISGTPAFEYNAVMLNPGDCIRFKSGPIPPTYFGVFVLNFNSEPENIPLFINGEKVVRRVPVKIDMGTTGYVQVSSDASAVGPVTLDKIYAGIFDSSKNRDERMFDDFGTINPLVLPNVERVPGGDRLIYDVDWLSREKLGMHDVVGSLDGGVCADADYERNVVVLEVENPVTALTYLEEENKLILDQAGTRSNPVHCIIPTSYIHVVNNGAEIKMNKTEYIYKGVADDMGIFSTSLLPTQLGEVYEVVGMIEEPTGWEARPVTWNDGARIFSLRGSSGDAGRNCTVLVKTTAPIDQVEHLIYAAVDRDRSTSYVDATRGEMLKLYEGCEVVPDEWKFSASWTWHFHQAGKDPVSIANIPDIVIEAPTKAANEGSYTVTCRLLNGEEKTSDHFYVEIFDSYAYPSTTAKRTPHNGVLTVESTVDVFPADLEYAVSWKKNERTIPGDTLTLHVSDSAAYADAGLYTCVIENLRSGDVRESSAPMYVGEYPAGCCNFVTNKESYAPDEDVLFDITGYVEPYVTEKAPYVELFNPSGIKVSTNKEDYLRWSYHTTATPGNLGVWTLKFWIWKPESGKYVYYDQQPVTLMLQ